MNPKQKIPLIAVAVVGALALAYTGASWWAGKQAETTLAKQHQLLADLPYFVVKSRDYQRGIFSSHERTTIALNPNLIKPYQLLQLQALGDVKLELSYTQTIKHGPLPLLLQGNPKPLKAAVSTEIEFNPDTQALLKKVFGDQQALQIENEIAFNDDGVVKVRIPNFTYEETLAKVKSVWQGLDATIAYGGDFNKVDISAVAPGLHFEAGTKGTLDIKDFRFEAHNQRGKAGLMLGDGKLTLASATFKRSEEDPALDIKLDKLSYLVNTTEKGEFIDSSGDVNLAGLLLNGKQYGPAVLSVSANHLHGPTLAKLSKRITDIQRKVTDPAEQAAKIFATLKTDGLPLLRNDPALSVKKLSVKLPEGEVFLKADLALKGFQDGDLDMPLKLLERLQASADLKVPKQVIETYVLWQARSMIAVDTEDGEHPDTADLENLARNLMESQIRKLTEQNLIKADGDTLSTSAEWKAGRLNVNGSAIPLPWQAAPAADAQMPTEEAPQQ
ncbi:YdgA family protein [Chitinimonas taiwanensis]|uniref:YdgA family protein n=1 Tax=Chitinimonas taiwanensis TaxID=240412 RepID=UPI0035B4A839